MLVNLTNIRTDGTMDAPAGAMARGLAVVKSSDTIAACGAGERPYGFLLIDVTADGLSTLEMDFIPHAEVEETKVSVGKVNVLIWEPGDIATDNIKAEETWAVGELIACTASGVLTNDPAQGDYYIGIVKAIDQMYGATTGVAVITLSHDLGTKA